MKDKRQFIVWGLGRFGSSVAETLTSLGHEVLGIDNNEDVVENMADKLTHAVVCDVIDEKTVNSLGIRNFDVGVVAIGNLEPSLLATLLLKEAGLKTIVAKASNPIHGKMLKKLGATKIIYPERDMAIRLANRLLAPGFLDFITLSEEVDLMELSVTQKIAEKTVQEINPRKMFGINLIAVKHNGSLEIEIKPDTVLHRGDTVCVIGTRENIRKFERFLNE